MHLPPPRVKRGILMALKMIGLLLLLLLFEYECVFSRLVEQ